MSDSLKKRFEAFEQTPPPLAWNNISRRLDNEYAAFDSTLSQKLEKAEIPPPAGAWKNISTALYKGDVKRAKVIPMVIRKTAVAAVIAIVLIAATMYFFQPTQTDVIAPPAQLSNNTPPAAADTPSSVPAEAPVQKQSVSQQSRKLAYHSRPVKRAVASRPAKSEPEPYLYETMDDMQETRIHTPQTVPAVQAINVSAPPIRDDNGNIIMDMDVISKPGQQYITVTGPNGDQTRISNKFIGCLRYLNNDIHPYDADLNAIECQSKFDEWRNKLLSEGAFIPSGDNFFDIFELKEMIQD